MIPSKKRIDDEDLPVKSYLRNIVAADYRRALYERNRYEKTQKI